MLASTVSRYEALEFLYSHVKTKSPDYIRALYKRIVIHIYDYITIISLANSETFVL